MQSLWQSCLNQLEKELPAQQFNTWIRPLAAGAEASSELQLVAPNRFVLQWVKDRFLGRIETMLAAQSGKSMRVVLALPESGEREAMPVRAGTARQPPRVPKPAVDRKGAERSSLSGEFSFENFVPGKANQLARAAAVQVAENPGTSYNPLFVYGGSGLGKTHLLHAIGNHVATHQKSAKARYLHANQYITDVVRAYQQRSFDAFKRYYHSLDLLLIDDIQFFTGKDRTQEEFFYAFNALRSEE